MKSDNHEDESSNMVQDLINVLVIPKRIHTDNFFHPYLDYQTDWMPKYNPDVNYANMFIKMCAIQGYLNEKLKDEVLLKSLL